MSKDCCCCSYWKPFEEQCELNDLAEQDFDTFWEECPKSNGEWPESNSED